MDFTKEEARLWERAAYSAAGRSRAHDRFEFFRYWCESLWDFILE